MGYTKQDWNDRIPPPSGEFAPGGNDPNQLNAGDPLNDWMDAVMRDPSLANRIGPPPTDRTGPAMDRWRAAFAAAGGIDLARQQRDDYARQNNLGQYAITGTGDYDVEGNFVGGGRGGYDADGTWEGRLGFRAGDVEGGVGGGDFDEDGNFVGGGQGGFDEDGNPVGTAPGGGAGVPQSEIESGVAEWNGFLQQWGLQGLEPFIRTAITQGWSFNKILQEIRRNPVYLEQFPENGIRDENGFSFIPEAQILEYRNEARRIAKTVLGIDVSNTEIANLVGNDISVREWEENLRVWKDFERWGPTVRAVLETEIGPISDDRAFAFLHPGIPTPELERAYENALYRARPAALGLGIRPQEEADILRQFGVDVNQAFKGSQGIAAELPRAERMAFIEQAVNQNPALPQNGSVLFNNTPYATLFRAIQLGDADAMQVLRDQMARESARSTQGGGTAFTGGAAVGMSSPQERARL